MSDFGKIEACFWQRGAGRRLRGNPTCQVLALYLLTCEQSRSLGLYYLPWPTAVSETGLSDSVAREALSVLEAEGFAFYDFDEDLVWIPSLALLRNGDELKPGDKRLVGIAKEFSKLPSHRFRDHLAALHGARFALPEQAPSKPLPSPIEAPSEPLPSPIEAPSEPLPSHIEAPSEPLPSPSQAPPIEEEEEGRRKKGEVEAEEREAPAAAVRLPDDPMARAILEALQSKPALRPIASSRHAETLAGKAHAGAKSLELVMFTLGQLSDAAQAASDAGEPWDAKHMALTAAKFIGAARQPRAAAKLGASPTREQIEAEQRRNGVQVGAQDWSATAVCAGELAAVDGDPGETERRRGGWVS